MSAAWTMSGLEKITVAWSRSFRRLAEGVSPSNTPASTSPVPPAAKASPKARNWSWHSALVGNSSRALPCGSERIISRMGAT